MSLVVTYTLYRYYSGRGAKVGEGYVVGEMAMPLNFGGGEVEIH